MERDGTQKWESKPPDGLNPPSISGMQNIENYNKLGCYTS